MLVTTFTKLSRWIDDGNGGRILVPHVTIFHGDNPVWSGDGFSVPHALSAIVEALGEPPWNPPLNLQIRAARCDHGHVSYVVYLE